MKIAIVNDVAMAAEALRRVVLSVPEYQIAWIARDGQEAVQLCAQDRPDVILMDLLMPVMDGVEATRRIMSANPCIILVVTATVEGNFQQVYAAMGHGALDAVATPVLGSHGRLDGAEALLRKIATVAMLIHDTAPKSSAKPFNVQAQQVPGNDSPLLLLGASTGGPQAVSQILAQLPGDFPAAVVLVQHVDCCFAEGLADWLGARTPLRVQIAPPGAALRVGTVLLAATNDHLILQPDHTLAYTPDPQDYPYRPSVDVLFKSVAGHWKGRGCAVVLTGMGRDGAEGLLALRAAGFHTVAQDKETSVVYGMPRAAAELNAAQEVLPVEEIASRIIFHFQPPVSPITSDTA
jgi:two-component system, chemotaxis family, response regulator WspF